MHVMLRWASASEAGQSQAIRRKTAAKVNPKDHPPTDHRADQQSVSHTHQCHLNECLDGCYDYSVAMVLSRSVIRRSSTFVAHRQIKICLTEMFYDDLHIHRNDNWKGNNKGNAPRRHGRQLQIQMSKAVPVTYRYDRPSS